MKGKIFVDTNVFIYAYSDDDMIKHKIAENLLRKDLAESSDPLNATRVMPKIV